MFLNNTSTKKKKKKPQDECKKNFLSENENTTYQNLWNAVKAKLRGKFIAMNAYFQKDQKLIISVSTLQN